MCSTFNVTCSWDGLLGERNCFCVWSFWCSELCSVDQTVTVQRGSVLDVRGPEWFFQPFCSLCEWMMNEWCIYIALYCVLLYTQSTLQSCGGGLSSTTTSVMRRLPQDNGASALTTHQLQVERRESHRDNQVYALTTHQLQVERRETVIETIKCMLSPHTSYRWRGERQS